MKTKFFTTIFLAFAFVIGIQAQDPTVAAPVPSKIYAANKVISIFSDSYTNIAGVNFNPAWNQKTVESNILIGGNNTLKYANLSYQGTDFNVDVNCVPMKYIHIDVYAATAMTVNFSIINHAPQSEKPYTLTLLANKWNSFDIPLTAYSGLTLTNIYQFKVDAPSVTTPTIYIDNLYFYDDSETVDTSAPTAFTATKGAVTWGTAELLLNATDNSGAINYEIKYGTKTLKAGGVSGVQKSYIVTGLNPSADYNFSVTAADATGNVAANNPIVVPVKTAFVAAPTTSAPIPPVRDAAKVISIFSNAYTNVANTNFQANWQQNTVVSPIQVAGTDDVLVYSNLNYQGTELGSDVNASAMNFLHIDVWTTNESMLTIQPLSRTGGGPVKAPLTPLNKDVWNSYNIPITTFAGLNLTDLFQFAIEGSSGKMIFIDNLYFYSTATGVKELDVNNTIKVYPNPVSDKMTIQSDSEISELTISNLVGQTIKTEKINLLQKTIDVSDIAAGNYFVSFKLVNGKSVTQKMVKQ